MYIKFVHKTFSFCKHFGAVLREEMRTVKFCTKVFVMLKHLMIKHIPSPKAQPPLTIEILFSKGHCAPNTESH